MANLSHKIALDPTAAQAAYFRRACGTARFVYNWALAEWKRQYAAGLKPNANALKKQFNAIKYQEFPWMQDIHRDAHARPFSALGVAFSGFFKGTSAYPMLRYKAPLYGTDLIEADRFYPSSKTCSRCGAVNAGLTLKDRAWLCPCGAEHDRDINAARNLANLALRGASAEVTPVRDEKAPKAARGRNMNQRTVNQRVPVPQP